MAFPSGQRAGRILLVDDGVSAPGVAAMLAQLGHIVVRAVTGNEALARFTNDSPDVVLFAVRLNDNAMRAARVLIAELPGGPPAPVAWICPRADAELGGAAVIAAGDDLIALPVSRPELA